MDGGDGKAPENIIRVVQRINPEGSVVDSAAVNDLIAVYRDCPIAILKDFSKDSIRAIVGTIHEAFVQSREELRGAKDEEKRSGKRKRENASDWKRSRKHREPKGYQAPQYQQYN